MPPAPHLPAAEAAGSRRAHRRPRCRRPGGRGADGGRVARRVLRRLRGPCSRPRRDPRRHDGAPGPGPPARLSAHRRGCGPPAAVRLAPGARVARRARVHRAAARDRPRHPRGGRAAPDVRNPGARCPGSGAPGWSRPGAAPGGAARDGCWPRTDPAPSSVQGTGLLPAGGFRRPRHPSHPACPASQRRLRPHPCRPRLRVATKRRAWPARLQRPAAGRSGGVDRRRGGADANGDAEARRPRGATPRRRCRCRSWPRSRSLSPGWSSSRAGLSRVAALPDPWRAGPDPGAAHHRGRSRPGARTAPEAPLDLIPARDGGTADASDSKSDDRKVMGVRISSRDHQ